MQINMYNVLFLIIITYYVCINYRQKMEKNKTTTTIQTTKTMC